MEQQKPIVFCLKLFILVFFVLTLVACQTQKSVESPSVEKFPVDSYSLKVKGVVFSIDLPLAPDESIQQQQDNMFASMKNEEGKSTVRYTYTSKLPDSDSSYLLKSGIQIRSPDHVFDTYLEYKFIGACFSKSGYLHCDYHAIEGRYVIDVPVAVLLPQRQTETQMEGSEKLIMSKLSSQSRLFKDVTETPYSLAALKKKAQSLKFSAAITNSVLTFSKPSYSYVTELAQEKIKKIYVTKINYEVFGQNNGLNSVDFVAGYKEAKKDTARVIGKE